MTPHEIVALRCPSCGGGITQPSREMPFGAEFRCDRCGITSVLIIDRALVPLSTLQKQGEKVCTVCGRVVQREARFCQEGHALTRECIKCLKEFAVDHQRCDFCGWLQSVKPGTVEGESLAFERAVSELASPSWQTLENALEVLIARAGTASKEAVAAAVSAVHSLMMDPSFRQRSRANDYDKNSIEEHCWQALGSLGPTALPTIFSMMREPSFRRTINEDGFDLTDAWSLRALRRLGPVARQVVPALRQRVEKILPPRWRTGEEGAEWNDLFGCLAAVSPEEALTICSRCLEEEGKNFSKQNEYAVKAAFALGKAAIPTLEKFCGTFSGSRGRLCKAAISALQNGEGLPYPLPT